MFFELRMYRMRPGKREAWVQLMEEKIIPYQISKGMVVIGSFVGEQDKDLFVWIRRFNSEEERAQLYAAVYEDKYWTDELSPIVGEMIDREQIQVIRMEATPRSVIQ